jgi:hypothetical protein
MKKGRAGTMTHDDKRHGAATLFAAMNVLDGAVIGRNMKRHRHQECIRFLNAVERAVPAGKTIHAILDNYAAHKHPAVISRPLSTGFSKTTTPIRNPSNGSPIQTKSSPPPNAAVKRWIRSTSSYARGQEARRG